MKTNDLLAFLTARLGEEYTTDELAQAINEASRCFAWKAGDVLFHQPSGFYYFFKSLTPNGKVHYYIALHKTNLGIISKESGSEFPSSEEFWPVSENREKEAYAILNEAGWKIEDGKLLPNYESGDWFILTDNLKFYIGGADGKNYRCFTPEGVELAVPYDFSSFRKGAVHKWTIKDAIPGELLISKDLSVVVSFAGVDKDDPEYFTSNFSISYRTPDSDYDEVNSESSDLWFAKSFNPITAEQKKIALDALKSYGFEISEDGSTLENKEYKLVEDCDFLVDVVSQLAAHKKMDYPTVASIANTVYEWCRKH